MGLLSLGTLVYGGANLNGPSVHTKSISAVPRMDAAGRGRTWTDYTIVLRLTIDGRPNDANVLALRTLLEQPGQRFFYSDKGYGPLVINVANSSDAIWGPITKTLAFESLGGANACYLDWEVKVAVPAAGGFPTGSAAPFIEILFTVDTDIDRAGYTTRRISVTGRIPSTRAGISRELNGTADDYRERFAPPLIPGFERTYPGWNIDDSKTIIRGDIVDTELGLNFLPPGVAIGNASHEVSSASQGLALWQASISADFELEKASAIDQFDLVSYFVGTLCKDRINSTAREIGKKSQAIVPLSFKMREDEIFGRLKASMSFGYSFTQEFAKIFGATGLWRPVPGSSWTKWAASMLGGPANPRGYAQVALQPLDDSIVEGYGGRMPGIFTNNPPVIPPNDGPNVPGLPQYHDRELRGAANPFPDPTPATSYIAYETWIWLEVDSGVIPVRQLPMKVPIAVNQVLTGNAFVPRPSQWAQNIIDVVADAAAGVMPPKVPGVAVGGVQAVLDAIAPQQRVSPLTYVFLRGSGMRYGFPVPIPALTDYLGVKPVLACRLDMGEGFGHGIKRAANGKPIFMAKWNLRYQIPGSQAFFYPPAIPNPLLDQS